MKWMREWGKANNILMEFFSSYLLIPLLQEQIFTYKITQLFHTPNTIILLIA